MKPIFNLLLLLAALMSFASATSAQTTLPSPAVDALTKAVQPILKQQGKSGAFSINGPDFPAVAIAAPQPVPPVLTRVTDQMVFDPAVSGRVIRDVVVTSADGKGFAGNVRGNGIVLDNVNFGDLADGFHYIGCDKLTITGGGQIGNTQGRCHYFLDVTHLTWTGDPAKVFGHATTQSPIRFSAPGVRDGTITGVRVTQAGSSNPIAGWAIHAAARVTFVGCESDYGEFSFDSAGSGQNDKVSDCIVQNLTITNSKLRIAAIAFGNTFKGGKFTNPTGEAISLSCAAGSKNVIDGAAIYSGSGHAIHFYAPSDCVIENCTFYRTNPKAVLMDGSCTKANDGGGNKIVDVAK